MNHIAYASLFTLITAVPPFFDIIIPPVTNICLLLAFVALIAYEVTAKKLGMKDADLAKRITKLEDQVQRMKSIDKVRGLRNV